MANRSLKLSDANDLDLSGGTLNFVSGRDAIKQAIRCNLQFFLGEWFLDTSVGLPWFQQVLKKNPNASVLKSIFREQILGTVGVVSLDSLELTFDSARRTLAVSFGATGDAGQFDQTVELTQ